MWGPASYTGIDGSQYYLFFVDHYTKYIWFYPMATKSSVSAVFPQFKKFLETSFQKKIKTLYSDNGDEFIALKSYFSSHCITHYTTALTFPNKMVSLNVVTVTLWKWALCYFKMQILTFCSGLCLSNVLPHKSTAHTTPPQQITF